jgi:SAM-dependent methyltransferase
VLDGGREVAFLVCRRCGHIYQSPRMTPDELAAFYTMGYRELRQGTEDLTTKDLAMQSARARVTVGLLGRRLPSVSRHLDLGSSSGALLGAFRDRFGSQAVGIEPGEVYRRHAAARGLRVFPSQAQLEEAGEAPFDLVTAMHVLEHLADPIQTLADLRRKHMKPEGFLLIEVPNVAEHEALELAHLHAFTRSSLKDTVGRAGFRVLWVRCHGSFRSPVLRLYITLLAQPTHHPHVRRYPPFAARRSRLARRIGDAKRRFFTRHFPDWTWQSPEKGLSHGP